MEINDRDHARRLIATAGITSDNVTREQLKILWHKLSKSLRNSENYHGTYRMNLPVGKKYMTCKTDQWGKREAVSFNSDGFIGFAGWADNSNIQPILQGIGDWLDSLALNNSAHEILLCEYLSIPYFLTQNPLQARKQMNKIKKALDVLSKTENPIIKADVIKVLREQFALLENSFDASCNHNTELQNEIAYLDAKIDSAMRCHPNVVHTLLREAKKRTHLNA